MAVQKNKETEGELKGSGQFSGVFELARAALWPSVALFVILYFSVHVRDILDGIATYIKSAQAIDLGYIKLTAKQGKLPPPDEEVARAIAGMSRNSLRFLLQHQPHTGLSICDQVDSSWSLKKQDYDDLVARSLVKYTNQTTSPHCTGPVYTAWLTDTGKEAQVYFQRVIIDAISN